jgi:hypothetical protein
MNALGVFEKKRRQISQREREIERLRVGSTAVIRVLAIASVFLMVMSGFEAKPMR